MLFTGRMERSSETSPAISRSWRVRFILRDWDLGKDLMRRVDVLECRFSEVCGKGDEGDRDTEGIFRASSSSVSETISTSAGDGER